METNAMKRSRLASARADASLFYFWDLKDSTGRIDGRVFAYQRYSMPAVKPLIQ
jgi:hypothetical protein